MNWIEFAKKYNIQNPLEFQADLNSIKADNIGTPTFLKGEWKSIGILSYFIRPEVKNEPNQPNP